MNDVPMSKLARDPRIDPRIKAVFALPDRPPPGDIESREALLEQANSPAAIAAVMPTIRSSALASSTSASPKARVKRTRRGARSSARPPPFDTKAAILP